MHFTPFRFVCISLLLFGHMACQKANEPATPESHAVMHLYEDAKEISGTQTLDRYEGDTRPLAPVSYPHDDAIWYGNWHNRNALRFESIIRGQLRGSLHMFHKPVPDRSFHLKLASWLDTEMEESWSGVTFWMTDNIHDAVGVRWKASGTHKSMTVEIFTYHTPELRPIATQTLPIVASRWAEIDIQVEGNNMTVQMDGSITVPAQLQDSVYFGNYFGLYQGEGTGYFSDIEVTAGEESFTMDDLFENWNLYMLNTSRAVLMDTFATPEDTIPLPVPVRRIPIANEWRAAVPVQCPSELRYKLDIPSQSELHVAWGVLPAFSLSSASAEIEIAVKGATEETVIHKTPFQPVNESMRWFKYHEVHASLSEFAGPDRELILRCNRFPPPNRRVTNDDPLVICWSEPVVAVKKKETKPNVLLLVIDTLRSDRLGIYGNPDGLTPNLDRLAQSGTAFLNTISQAPWTLPSHVTMFTGLYPTETGCANIAERGYILQEGYLTWAEIFQRNGYHTLGLTSGVKVRGELGFNQGFDTYQDIDYNQSYSFEAVQERFRHWLDTHNDEPWFAFLHTYAVHFPYNHKQYMDYRDVVRSWNDRRQNDIDTYDGGVRYIDEWVGILETELKRRGLLDNTVLIITSDHGEDLGERGMPRPAHHGHHLYDTLLHVPLIVRYPEAVPQNVQVENQVRLIDIMPTVLELMDWETPAWCHGSDLMPLMKKVEEPERLAFSEAMIYGVQQFSLRTSTYKLILAPDLSKTLNPTPSLVPVPVPDKIQLYDLVNDPMETTNIADTNTEKRNELTRILTLLRKSFYPTDLFTAGGMIRELPPPSATLQEELQALGYTAK